MIAKLDDSPPSIRIKIGSGSGAFEPSGVLAVLPGSTIHLDCMYMKRKGTPEWTWTGWHRTYQTGQYFNELLSLKYSNARFIGFNLTKYFFFILNRLAFNTR